MGLLISATEKDENVVRLSRIVARHACWVDAGFGICGCHKRRDQRRGDHNVRVMYSSRYVNGRFYFSRTYFGVPLGAKSRIHADRETDGNPVRQR